jgi:hypothetical protein
VRASTEFVGGADASICCFCFARFAEADDAVRLALAGDDLEASHPAAEHARSFCYANASVALTDDRSRASGGRSL